MAVEKFEPDALPFFNHPEVQRLADFMHRQHRRIAANLEGVDRVSLFVRHREPDKVENGLVVYADGSDWNPGSGEGFYGYYNSGWHFLG